KTTTSHGCRAKGVRRSTDYLPRRPYVAFGRPTYTEAVRRLGGSALQRIALSGYERPDQLPIEAECRTQGRREPEQPARARHPSGNGDLTSGEERLIA